MTGPGPTPLRDELDLAVARLVRAVGSGRLHQSGRREEDLAELSEALVVELHAALRMARVEDLNPATILTATRRLGQRLEGLVSLLGPVRLQLVDGRAFVARRRLRLEGQSNVATGLARELDRHACGGFVFHEALDPDELWQLLALLSGATGGAGEGLGSLEESLAALGIESVHVLPALDLDLPPEVESASPGGEPTQALHRCLEACLDEISRGREPDFQALREAVSEVLPAIRRSGQAPLLPRSASPYSAHLGRVCALALQLGLALHLDGGALQELGCLALLHDADALLVDEADSQSARIRWMRVLLRRRGFHPGRVRRLLGFLQHERDLVGGAAVPSAFARIIRVADDYDNLVRVDGGGMSPAHALELISGGAGQAYDPVVVQELVNLLGRYPPGTLLELVDGRLVRVLSTCRSPATFGAPLCELVRLQSGMSPAEPQQIDLASEGEVLRVVQPS